MDRLVFIKFLLSIYLLLVFGCSKDLNRPIPQANNLSSSLVSKWHQQWKTMVSSTPGYNLPSSSRALAFCGMAMYESILPSIPHYSSLSRSIPQWPYPITFDPNKEYSPELALNNSMRILARSFFKTAPYAILNNMESLYKKERDSLILIYSEPDLIKRSELWGTQVAELFIALNESDRFGYDTYVIDTFNFVALNTPQQWTPTPPTFNPPLLPYWGNAYSFGVFVDNIESLPPITYDTSIQSSFYNEANELYQISKDLNQEKINKANYWDESMPIAAGISYRWASICDQYIQDKNASLEKAVLAYLRTSLAIYNANLIAWKSKYKFQQLRPITYIQKYISSDFNSYIPSPAYPEYISEHAIISSAAANIITYEFGSTVFKDRTEPAGSTSLEFDNVMLASHDCGISRLYAGTQFRSSIEEGNRLGLLVANQVLEIINWHY